MNLLAPITGLLQEGLEIWKKHIPDKDLAAKLEAQFQEKVLGGLMGLVQGQLEINKTEAQHSSLFVAGWRPAIGWVCGFGLAWNFIIQPMLVWAMFAFDPSIMVMDGGQPRPLPPELDIGDLITILLGMLGLGGLRTYEKQLGVARDTLAQPEPQTAKKGWRFWKRNED